MLIIIWYHAKACVRDLRSRKSLGNAIEMEQRAGGQLVVSNGRRTWRLR